MLNKLKCWILGHKRGKAHSLIRAQDSGKVVARMFICPRCESTWTRKVSEKKVAA